MSLKTVVAGAALSQGETATSYKLLLECLMLFPSYIPAQELLAVNRLLSSDFESSADEFDQLLRIDPDSKLGLWGKTLLAVKRGNTGSAIDGLIEMSQDTRVGEVSREILGAILGVDPHNIEEAGFVAKARKIQSERSKTAHDMLSELGSDTENARLKIILARHLVDRGERVNAMKILIRMTDAYPHYPNLLYTISKILRFEGRLDEARPFLQAAFEACPTTPDPEGFFKDYTSPYTHTDDFEGIFDLKDWCETVLVQFATSEVAAKIERKLPLTKIAPDKQKEAPTKQEQKLEEGEAKPQEISEVSEVSDKEPATQPIESKQATEATKPEPTPPKTTTAKSLTPEDIETHQLEKARQILEEARRILDQTKKAEEGKPKEVDSLIDQRLDTKPHVAQPTQEPADEGVKLAQPTKESEEEHALETEQPVFMPDSHDEEPEFPDIMPTREDGLVEELTERKEIAEEPEQTEFEDTSDKEFMEEPPKRIVLPTTEEETESDESVAWALLKEGNAEEALYLFSKLIRAERGI